MLAILIWLALALIGALAGALLTARLLDGGLATLFRISARALPVPSATHAPVSGPGAGSLGDALGGVLSAGLAVTSACLGSALLLLALRLRARGRRRYVRLGICIYRGDRAGAQALVTMFETLHKRLLVAPGRRLLSGQPSMSLEIGYGDAGSPATGTGAHCVSFAVTCERGQERLIEAALRAAYPNLRLQVGGAEPEVRPVLLRLVKRAHFAKPVRVLDRFEQEREPPMNRLLNVLGACGEPALVQLALTPAPIGLARWARGAMRRRESVLARRGARTRTRSVVGEAELRSELVAQHRSLFFVDLRVLAGSRRTCEQIASELRVERLDGSLVENGLLVRGTAIRHGLLGLYSRRVRRGEGNPLPSLRRCVFASPELAGLWQLPSGDFAAVPLRRGGVPVAPASPEVFRPTTGPGILRDDIGGLSIHPQLRRQNVAAPGTVDQGKSSFLVASIAEDLRRERCAVILLDPKGDAAEAALSLVPEQRTCTLLDFADPTAGFNPLAADAPADVIADYAVAALRQLFTDADIRASSDRYLRNAIIAVLAFDPMASLWDAARLLSVGEEGYAYRRLVGARLRTLPQYKEIAEFFTAELTAQLADARSTTTAKLDAPVNKLARLLNSPSIKRILLNDSLRVDLDRVIAGREVLIVKGALGAMGAGNTGVLMQLLLGMLDAALARQQDLLPAARRNAIALKIDEAPLVINRGFAETMALKRSAGLETVACWQADAQWTDRDVRGQLDALFAHRVYFATASAGDARAAVTLTMAEFSDSVRPGSPHLSALGRPDVRLHLPRHHAIVSLLTPGGRQAPFIAQTIPMRVDPRRIARHADLQRARGGRRLTDLQQRHWERARPGRTTDRSEHGSRARFQPAPAGEASDRPAASPDGGERGTALPASFAELLDLDRARSVRRARPAAGHERFALEPLDLEILELLAQLGHLLASQIHRRFNGGRAATTTQRRLKRLADAGMIERLQFHREDGGGVSMCCRLAAEGLRTLRTAGLFTPEEAPRERPSGRAAPAGVDERTLRSIRQQLHVAGWAIALERLLGTRVAIFGTEASCASPPERRRGEHTRSLGPSDLRLPGGRVAHDFLRTDRAGARLEAERFQSIRPDARIELPGTIAGEPVPQAGVAPDARHSSAVDLLLERDDRLPPGGATAKLERYDHFLSGWSLHTSRHGPAGRAVPLVVFLCRDPRRARELARCADRVLCAAHAYVGEHPFHWHYPGRARTLFASEREVHEGRLDAVGLAPLPPEVRSAASGEGAARAAVERRVLLPIGAQAASRGETHALGSPG